MVKKTVRLVVTDVCNFKCPFCYNEGNITKNENVKLDAKKTIQYIKKIKKHIDKITLTGGEPLLYPDFDYIVKEIAKLNIPIQLTTNGYYLDKLIKNDDVLQLIQQINVSLDDLNENEFRIGYICDKEIYDKVISNIVELCSLTNRPNVFINCVIDEKNINKNCINRMLNFIDVNNINGIKYIPLINGDEKKIIGILKKNLEMVTEGELIYNFSKKLIDNYTYNNKIIMILHQYCNNDCSTCKEDGFIRINSDGNIYDCLFDKKQYKNIYAEVEDDEG